MIPALFHMADAPSMELSKAYWHVYDAEEDCIASWKPASSGICKES